MLHQGRNYIPDLFLLPAALTDVHMAEMTRRHNDANMLAMGGRTTDEKTALEITAAWLDTEFEGGRHQRRVDMLNNM